MCLASTTDKQAKIRTAVGNAKLPEGSTAAQLSCYMQDLWEIWKLDVLNHDARVAVAASRSRGHGYGGTHTAGRLRKASLLGVPYVLWSYFGLTICSVLSLLSRNMDV